MRTRCLQTVAVLAAALMPLGCGEDSSSAGGGDFKCGQTPRDGSSIEGFCDGGAVHVWEPAAVSIGGFPDHFFTTDDTATATGLRVTANEIALAEFSHWPDNLTASLPQLFELDGFGTQSPAMIILDTPIDSEALPAGFLGTDGPAWLIALPAGQAPYKVPIDIFYVDNDTTIFMEPLVPLPPSTRVVAMLSRDIPLKEAGCLAPSIVSQQLLKGRVCDEAYERMGAPYTAASQALIDAGFIQDVTDIGAFLVYTTQSVVEDSMAIAENIRSRDFQFTRTPRCENRQSFRHCRGQFQAGNYQGDDGIVRLEGSAEPKSKYELPVELWIPQEAGDFGPAPYPTVIFGHGLGGDPSDRAQMDSIADFVTRQGIALVAIPAPFHGSHPGGATGQQALDIASFFGINPIAFSIDGFKARDNFRASTYDKLQLIELLRASPDVDGDGADDIDLEALSYFGASLGGIMGPELLSLTDGLAGAVLMIGGTRLVSIIQDSSSFGPFVDFLTPGNFSERDKQLFFMLAQTLLERGDGGNYAPFVFDNRLAGSGDTAPHLLVGMAVGDEVVPNSSTEFMTRALGVPHVPPVIVEFDLLDQAPAAPVSGNLNGLTAGLFQLDVVERLGGDGTSPVSHQNAVGSRVGIHLWGNFLRELFGEQVPQIRDPYTELGIK